MKKRALVPIADGSEEIEAVTVVDVLRRGSVDVVLASVGSREIQASRGVHITADCTIDQCSDDVFDLIALPGGMPGAEHLRDCEILTTLLRQQKANGRLYAAICASPAVVFHPHGLLEGLRATSHPAHWDSLDKKDTVEQRVVVDGNCVTSQGPGTALEWALTLIRILRGAEVANKIADAMGAKWL